jgi:hypothetical protein
MEVRRQIGDRMALDGAHRALDGLAPAQRAVDDDELDRRVGPACLCDRHLGLGHALVDGEHQPVEVGRRGRSGRLVL